MFALFAVLLLTACGSGGTNGGEDSEEDYDVYVDDGPFEGWIDALYEPFGDESWCYYRVTPGDYAPGDTVTLEIAAGSGYGPISENTVLSYRCTGDSTEDEYSRINDHTAGKPWQVLKPAGEFYTKYDEAKEAYEDKWYRYTDNVSEDDMYDAFVHFKQSFTVPEDGSSIELRVEQPGGRFAGIRIPPTDYAIAIYPLLDIEEE